MAPIGLFSHAGSFPRCIGRDNGLNQVEVKAGVFKQLTDDEWKDLQDPGASARERIDRAVQTIQRSAEQAGEEAVMMALMVLHDQFGHLLESPATPEPPAKEEADEPKPDTTKPKQK